MAALQHDDSSEHEEEEIPQFPGPTQAQIDELFRGLTSERLQKLIRIADKVKEEESPIMKALRDIDPDFKGDFVNFKVKDITYAEFSTQVPDLPEGFPFLELEPVEKVVQRDTEDLKAMNLVLTGVAKRLQLAIKYLLTALDATDDGVETGVSEGLFRGLCLTGDAFSTLQVERFTTPRTRKTIAVSRTDSQIPLVVQKAKKDLFFRSGAGASRAASHSADEEEDESASDSDRFMRPKGRAAFTRMQRTFRPRRRTPRRPPRRTFDGPRLYQGKPRFKFVPRHWDARPAAPPAPPGAGEWGGGADRAAESLPLRRTKPQRRTPSWSRSDAG
jgi:hypothetical protein